jgi:hypothetical protein
LWLLFVTQKYQANRKWRVKKQQRHKNTTIDDIILSKRFLFFRCLLFRFLSPSLFSPPISWMCVYKIMVVFLFFKLSFFGNVAKVTEKKQKKIKSSVWRKKVTCTGILRKKFIFFVPFGNPLLVLRFHFWRLRKKKFPYQLLRLSFVLKLQQKNKERRKNGWENQMERCSVRRKLKIVFEFERKETMIWYKLDAVGIGIATCWRNANWMSIIAR